MDQINDGTCVQKYEMCDVRDTQALTVDMKAEQGVIYSSLRYPRV